MIPGADLITVTPVGRVAPAASAEAAGDARQQEFQRSLAGLVGKSMQAEVLSRLTDGSFLVKVAGTSARMMLPSNPQPGAELPLTLVSVSPRPTFQISTAPQSAAIAAFFHPQPAVPGSGVEPALYTPAAAGMPKASPEPPASALQRAAGGLAEAPLPGAATALPAAANAVMTKTAPARAAGAMQRAANLFGEAPLASQLPEADSASALSTLSPAARVISSVLAAAFKSEHPQTAIMAPLPLLASASAAADPVKLAAVLKDAIGASGLFYESHVAEWSAGQRPLADLLREPQMQRAPAAGAGAAGPGSAPAAADPATAQFINLQLASQEQGRVAWQGQLWPGQELAWQISRDAPERRDHAGGEPPEPPWRSALRLRFPLLGEIGATVVLAGDQLHIQLQAGSDEVGSLLRARAGELYHALEASGAVPASLTVSSSGERGHG
jgi:hypothetical protein